MFAEYPPLMSRIASRDPASVIALFILIPTVQLLLWGIGRYSLDTEWWKGTCLSVVLVVLSMMILPIMDNDFKTQIGFYSLCALAVWILSNFLYEPELWQRVVLTLVSPLLGAGAWIAGIAIRMAVFGW